MTTETASNNDPVHSSLYHIATQQSDPSVPAYQLVQRSFLDLGDAFCAGSAVVSTPLQSSVPALHRQIKVVSKTLPLWSHTEGGWGDPETLLSHGTALYRALAVYEQALSTCLGHPVSFRDLAYQQMVAEGGD